MTDAFLSCQVCGMRIEMFDGLMNMKCPKCGVHISRTTPAYKATNVKTKCEICEDTGVIDNFEIFNDTPYVMHYACSCDAGKRLAYVNDYNEQGAPAYELSADGSKKQKVKRGMTFYRERFECTARSADEQRKRNGLLSASYWKDRPVPKWVKPDETK